jgi:hypothetical protein
MKQASVKLANDYIAAAKGGKGGNQGGAGGNRGGKQNQDREGMGREETDRRGGDKSNQDRDQMPETGRKGSDKGQDGGRGKGNNSNR